MLKRWSTAAAANARARVIGQREKEWKFETDPHEGSPCLPRGARCYSLVLLSYSRMIHRFKDRISHLRTTTKMLIALY